VIETVLVELVRSASLTFPRVLLLTAHGGNAVPVTRAVERLRDERRDVVAWNPASAWDGDAHAGLIETSVMLALMPETVDMTRAAAGNTQPLRELLPDLVHGGVAAVSPNGVLGDPSGASRDYGWTLLAQAVVALTEFIALWPAPALAR
jgi:creatinine amidohydrolase/Fe(II)-dependent formamide hydrolase-like protein